MAADRITFRFGRLVIPSLSNLSLREIGNNDPKLVDSSKEFNQGTTCKEAPDKCRTCIVREVCEVPKV